MSILRGGAHGKSLALPDLVSIKNDVGTNWMRIYRYPNLIIAKKLTLAMIAACNNDTIGYDLDRRETLWKALLNNNKNINLAFPTTVYTDCSNLIAVCCLLIGLNVPTSMYTGDQPSILKSVGFQEYEFNINNLLVGDVLWRRSGDSGHTEIVVSMNGSVPYQGGAVSSNSGIFSAIANGIGNLISNVGDIIFNNNGINDDMTINKTYKNYRAIFEDRSTEVIKDSLITADLNYIQKGGYNNLLTYPSLVEVPFILFKVGKYTFGKYTKSQDGQSQKIDFPNYIDSMTVTKINGLLNKYSIRLTYQITTGDDPNLLDKIFSSVGFGKVYITYGDYSSPTFIYKEEEAILTKAVSSVDYNNSRISYDIECTSSALLLASNVFDFPALTNKKPSEVIEKIIKDPTYGLLNVFTGMSNWTKVKNNNLLATDDKPVDIQAKNSIDPLSYINYLVSCMSSITNNDSVIKDSTYRLTIYDDNYGDLNLKGSYFKITKISVGAKIVQSADTYNVDIGYPTDNMVTLFNVSSNNSWSLLYNYNENILTPQYTYDIDKNGNLVTNYSPNYALNSTKNKMTESLKTWWTNMTQFPINGSLTIKGLVRPTLLMSYIRINALFYGLKHISSGLYIITGLQDSINSSGYRTTLSLTRIAGDDDYIEKTKTLITSKVLVGYDVTESSSVNRLIDMNKALTVDMSDQMVEFNNQYTTTNLIPNSSMYSSDASIEATIWNTFMKLLNNPYAAAGFMGNLQHESELKPNTVENLCKNLIKANGGPSYTNESYTAAVNNGSISRAEFLVPLLKYGNPSSTLYSSGRHYGYGLALWTDDSRKGGLYDFMMSRGKGIDDPAGLVEYIIKELNSGFSTVMTQLKSATSIDSATEIVYNKYERPGSKDTSLPTRKQKAKEFYAKYIG